MTSRMMNTAINPNNPDVTPRARSTLITMSAPVIINDGAKKLSAWCKGDKPCNALRKGRRFNANATKKEVIAPLPGKDFDAEAR